jgi:hypothetical protein
MNANVSGHRRQGAYLINHKKEASPESGAFRMEQGLVTYVQLDFRRRRIPAAPARPTPNSERVKGSGTSAMATLASPMYSVPWLPWNNRVVLGQLAAKVSDSGCQKLGDVVFVLVNTTFATLPARTFTPSGVPSELELPIEGQQICLAYSGCNRLRNPSKGRIVIVSRQIQKKLP